MMQELYGRFCFVVTEAGVSTLRRWRRELEEVLDGASVELSEYQFRERLMLAWTNAEIVRRDVVTDSEARDIFHEMFEWKDG